MRQIRLGMRGLDLGRASLKRRESLPERFSDYALVDVECLIFFQLAHTICLQDLG